MNLIFICGRYLPCYNVGVFIQAKIITTKALQIHSKPSNTIMYLDVRNILGGSHTEQWWRWSNYTIGNLIQRIERLHDGFGAGEEREN
jgi:hypothetical protein